MPVPIDTVTVFDNGFLRVSYPRRLHPDALVPDHTPNLKRAARLQSILWGWTNRASQTSRDLLSSIKPFMVSTAKHATRYFHKTERWLASARQYDRVETTGISPWSPGGEERGLSLPPTTFPDRRLRVITAAAELSPDEVPVLALWLDAPQRFTIGLWANPTAQIDQVKDALKLDALWRRPSFLSRLSWRLPSFSAARLWTFISFFWRLWINRKWFISFVIGTSILTLVAGNWTSLGGFVLRLLANCLLGSSALLLYWYYS